MRIVERDLEKGKQRGKSKTPDTGTWPPKIKRGVSLYEDLERPKTANLEKPSVLDPKLVDKLDMSLLSKELLSDSMTRFRYTKTISGGVRSRCKEVGEQQQQQQRPMSNGVAATWSNGLGSQRQKRRSFEQILDLRLGQLDVAAESPRMQKQARTTGQDVAALKKGNDNRKLDDNNNRFVPGSIYEVGTLKTQLTIYYISTRKSSTILVHVSYLVKCGKNVALTGNSV